MYRYTDIVTPLFADKYTHTSAAYLSDLSIEQPGPGGGRGAQQPRPRPLQPRRGLGDLLRGGAALSQPGHRYVE